LQKIIKEKISGKVDPTFKMEIVMKNLSLIDGKKEQYPGTNSIVHHLSALLVVSIISSFFT